MAIESVMLSNHLVLCRPLLLQPLIFPTVSVFFNSLEKDIDKLPQIQVQAPVVQGTQVCLGPSRPLTPWGPPQPPLPYVRGPHHRAEDWYLLSDQQQLRLEVKCTINKMLLNHPEIMTLPPVQGKIILHKIGPWCQKVWVPPPHVTNEAVRLAPFMPLGETAKEIAHQQSSHHRHVSSGFKTTWRGHTPKSTFLEA